ncbi:MAG: LytTR family transcriptional regulator [Bacteroidales bacterium]|nr:LytTR family transcriptional regulator [Bacteroidales bacterium]MCF8403241.1 LytTR family transcriptional regulator [Bacteroidales bacterium]
MLKFLNKPYPFNDDLKHNTKVIFFISVGVFAFLFLFQPLQIDALASKEKYILVIGLGVITFLSLSLNLLILPSLFPKVFHGSSWNVKKEIFWDIWILFTVSVGYFLYYKTLGIMEFKFAMILKLILIAIVPISVLITFNRNRLLRSHLKSANELNQKLQENKSIPDRLVHFISDYQKDNLSLKVSLILFVRSANNYIEIFWKEGQEIKSQMVRYSLTKAEELLKDYKFVFKCHRSYLTNINMIDKIEGSSQGYRLYFEKIDFPIPVSKNYAHRLKELI